MRAFPLFAGSVALLLAASLVPRDARA